MGIGSAGFRLLVAVSLVGALGQHVAVYRARHRPVGELLVLAESSLGAGGRVAVDDRTAALVLTGERADVERTLALLAELDRPLRTLVIEHSLEETEALRAAGLLVDWSARRGPLRVGTLVSRSRSGAAVSAGAVRADASRAFTARLRILEGEPGWLLTGASRVLPGRFAVEERADSGFEAVATLLGSGRVHVELRPFDGRLETGGVRYTAAATALDLEPGETVVVAETATGSERTAVEIPRGSVRETSGSRTVLLLRVVVEP